MWGLPCLWWPVPCIRLSSIHNSRCHMVPTSCGSMQGLCVWCGRCKGQGWYIWIIHWRVWMGALYSIIDHAAYFTSILNVEYTRCFISLFQAVPDEADKQTIWYWCTQRSGWEKWLRVGAAQRGQGATGNQYLLHAFHFARIFEKNRRLKNVLNI